MEHFHSCGEMAFQDIGIELLDAQISVLELKRTVDGAERSGNLIGPNRKCLTVELAGDTQRFEERLFGDTLIIHPTAETDVALGQRRILENFRYFLSYENAFIVAIHHGVGKIRDVEARGHARLSGAEGDGVEGD